MPPVEHRFLHDGLRVAAVEWGDPGGVPLLALHGGMGVDLDHPIHRYLLLGREITDSFGGPSQELDRLGNLLDELPVLAS